MAENSSLHAVVDASFVLAFLLPDEVHPEVDSVFAKLGESTLNLTSTTFLPYEVLNGLKTATLTHRLSPKTAHKLAHLFLKLPVSLKPPDLKIVFKLALVHRLSVYDAAYVQLKRALKLPLYTLDTQLKRF